MAFAVISLVLVYTTISNVFERPDGAKIGVCFIAAIMAVSIASRVSRVFELRTTQVSIDRVAEIFVSDCARRSIRFVAKKPGGSDLEQYSERVRQVRLDHESTVESDLIFVEVTVSDPSDFEGTLAVHGRVEHGQFRVVCVESPSIPNALASLTLAVRNRTGVIPHLYFTWTEGNPIAQFLRFLLLGRGEVAPVTREVLRRAEPDMSRRPRVHVG